MSTITYLEALTAMEMLLSAVEINFWRDSIRTNIQSWHDSQDTKSHLYLYGGMGSFNDVYICKANGYKVTDDQTPWVNILFDWLKTLCYHLAKEETHTLRLEEIPLKIGRSDPCLAAFWSPSEEATLHRQTEQRKEEAKQKISGQRCLQCGYGEVSAINIEWLLSQIVVPKMLFAEGNLNAAIEKILKIDVPNIQAMRDELSTKLVSSGITFRPEIRDLRPCPQCGSNDTAAYRWTLTQDGSGYEPSDDNLALRKK